MAPTGFGTGSAGALFPVVKLMQTNSLFTTGRFTGVVVKADLTISPGDNIQFFASANGGTNLEPVGVNVFHTFLTQGSDLLVKARLAGTGGAGTYFENLEVGGTINNFRLSFGSYNGSDNYITVADTADHDFTNAFSIALAVNVTSLPGATKYLMNKWTGTNGYAVRINASDQVELIYSDGGSDTVFNTNTTLVANTWQHVVFTKSGTSLIVYVNGSSANTATGGSVVGTNNNAFEVGRYTTNYFSGQLDEVRLYSDELTSSEAANLFNKKEHLSSNVLYWSQDNPLLGDRFGARRPVV